MTDADIVIVGSGMAGATLAALLAAHRRVIVIEAENAPGYHATGRSVAFWTESYGGPGVQPLTSASGPMLRDLALWLPGATGKVLARRGALHIGTADDQPACEQMLDDFADSGIALDVLDAGSLHRRLAGLRAPWTVGLWEGTCADIDVSALHQAALASARRQGAQIRCNARLTGAARDSGGWRISTTDGPMRCGMIVNAAGAWADEVAQACSVAPVGITPLRRTVVQVRLGDMPDMLPLVIGLDGSFYFKAAGDRRIWLSPHDEHPSAAVDAAPDEMDVARAIDRFESVVDWPVESVERRWAGLRSFAPDRLPVIGADPLVPDFFWLAGQGGFGIQTAPAIALIAAAQITGTPPARWVAAIDAGRYSPDRFDL